MISRRLQGFPTPVAGFALGIASLGWTWQQNITHTDALRLLCAVAAALLVSPLIVKYLRYPHIFRQDMLHPVTGSVIPTLSMATMVISTALPEPGRILLWLMAISAHLCFLCLFIRARIASFALEDMVPSWFVPPVGIIVASVTFPENDWLWVANGLFWFGLGCYAVLLPIMINRLIFKVNIAASAQPTIAIMAAPASLSLAGYLTIAPHPNELIVTMLLGIALLMTLIIYLAFFHLLRIPFSVGFAAYTFPTVISASALFKVASFYENTGRHSEASTLHSMAIFELCIASAVVLFVGRGFVKLYAMQPNLSE